MPVGGGVVNTEEIKGHIKDVFQRSEFGERFLDIFARSDREFYKLDKMLFSPASVRIENQATGTIWDVGEIRYDVLRRSFGIE